MIRTRTEKLIDVQDWDNLVTETYGRPYAFQQQDGCKERQLVPITVPDECYDFENDTVPEIVNGHKMGVSFKAWLARDPKTTLPDRDDTFGLVLWWERNFYPDVQMIANDLCEKGLIEAGDYMINIDW